MSMIVLCNVIHVFLCKNHLFVPAVVNCGHLELPLHARYVSMEGAMFNQTTSVRCLPGFDPGDVFELTCGADATWNGSLPNCTACENIHLVQMTWPVAMQLYGNIHSPSTNLRHQISETQISKPS